MTESRTETEASHDLSVGLRENYRARWKTAINAVRASTKFRTFAALAADGKPGKLDDDSGGVTPPTKSELYSDSSLEDEGYLTGEDGEGNDNDKPEAVGKLADKLQSTKV